MEAKLDYMENKLQVTSCKIQKPSFKCANTLQRYELWKLQGKLTFDLWLTFWSTVDFWPNSWPKSNLYPRPISKSFQNISKPCVMVDSLCSSSMPSFFKSPSHQVLLMIKSMPMPSWPKCEAIYHIHQPCKISHDAKLDPT